MKGGPNDFKRRFAKSSFFARLTVPLSLGWRYGLAVLLVGIAFTVRYLLRSALEEHAAFIMFVPAIMVAAWWGGIGPALVALTLSGMLATYCFLPFATAGDFDVTMLVSTVIYLFSIVTVMVLMKQLRDRSDSLETELDQRRQLEHQLRQSEERCHKVFEFAGVGIVQLDAEGYFLEANAKFCDILGYTNGELQGRKVFDFLIDEDRENHVRMFKKLVAGELSVIHREKRYVRKGGKIIWGSVTAVFLRDAQGNPQTSISVVEEITARVEAEAALREAQQQLAVHAEELERRVVERTSALHDSMKDMEDFCYSIAHDLRAPLRAMRGFSYALIEDYGPNLGEEGKRFCDRIGDAGVRMEEMITGLLEYGRISQAHIDIQSVNVLSTVEKVLAETVGDIAKLGAEIVMNKPLANLCGNPVLLQQVLRNLIANALKFVPPGTAPKVHIYTEQRGQSVRLYVEDNGIGIAPENQDRIFQPFYRLHRDTIFAGNGIGLALVKKAVEKMRGGIGVESSIGRGSRFWVELRGREKCPCPERTACAPINGV